MQTIAQQLGIKKFPFRINDDKGNVIYYETSDGFWHKQEFDEKGNRIYHENSDGVIEDNRPKCENKVVAQQTAVDWLVNKIYMVIPNEERNFLQGLKDEANQMFEEQIMNARLNGFKESAEGWNGEYPGWDDKETSIKINNEQYYNETYGK